MKKQKLFLNLSLGVAVLWAGSAYGAAQSAGGAGGQFISNNTPRFAATAKNLGPADSSAVIDVSIWLNLHNRGELDALAKELYDRNSSNYRQWLDRAEFAARFAPTQQEANAVQDFFTAHNLRIITVGPDNFFVRARGTVGDVQKAFHVEIAQFAINGKIYRGNIADPYVEGPAGALVQAVYGLDNLEFKHPLVTRTTKGSVGKPALPTGFESAAVNADPDFFTSNCFTGPETQTYTTGGSFPIATYTGNGYNGTQNFRLRLHAPRDPYGLQFVGPV